MHYSRYAFSMNGKPTIIPTQNASAVIGQNIGLSPTDILEIQKYYGCVPTSSVGRKLISLISLYSLFNLIITIINTF